MTRRVLKVAVALTASLALVGACSDSKTVGSDSTVVVASHGSVAETLPATDAATTSVTTTVTTTVAGTTTTSASNSTTVVAVAELMLRNLGVGSFALGDTAALVIDGISAQLGAPVRDESAVYPTADGLGGYTTGDGEIGFVAPMSRTVCWSINLCAEFGGGNTASMSFTGWTYANDPTAALSSASGGTIGVRWSDLPALEVAKGGCYSVGTGTIDGIRATLESTGAPFSSFDDAGNYIATVPDAADVTITSMEAGKAPVFLFGDC